MVIVRTARNHAYLTVIVALLLIAPTSLPALDLDWGGTLDSFASGRFGATEADADYRFYVRSGLWLHGYRGFDSGGSFDIYGSASYTATDERPYLVDVDMLRIEGRYPGLLGARSHLQTTAGRALFRDPTGLVLNHRADGMSLRVSFPRFDVRLGAAYTGLLANPTSAVRLSQSDYRELDDDSVFFAPARAIGLIDLGSPNARFFVVAQFDLRRDDGDEASDTIDSQYFGIDLTSRLGRALYWDNSAVIGTAQTKVGAAEDYLVSFLVTSGVRAFIEEAGLSRLGLRLLYTSPYIPLEFTEADDGFDLELLLGEFRPISEPTLGFVFTPRLANLAVAELDYAVRPFAGPVRGNGDSVQVATAGRLFFRSYTGDSEYLADLDPDSRHPYLGTEVEVGVRTRILDDIGAGIRCGVFVPGVAPAGAFASGRNSEWMLRVDISTAF